MAKKLMPGTTVKPKKKCCKSGPRCKRCPTALKRLETQGLATRRSDGRFVIVDVVSKAQLKAARRRRG